MSEYTSKPEEKFEPVHTNKVGGSPYKGVVGWIDNRLPIITPKPQNPVVLIHS